jgi:hypothetical protein
MNFHRSNTKTLGWTVRAAAVVVLVAAGFTSPLLASAAHAADSCGSGWHKQSDGAMGSSSSNSSAGRVATAANGGWVRYCTRSRTGYDQLNQKVLVGLPNKITASGTFSGNGIVSVCTKLTVTVNAAHVSSGTSIGLSGVSPGFSVSTGPASKTATRETCSSQPTTRLVIEPAQMDFSVPNCTYPCFADPKITSVRLMTVSTVTYRSGTSQTLFDVKAVDTDVPN